MNAISVTIVQGLVYPHGLPGFVDQASCQDEDCANLDTMTDKPFRPPFMKNADRFAASVHQPNDGPESKKRRIGDYHEDNAKLSAPQLVFKKPGISSLPRKPLLALKNPAASLAQATQPLDGGIEGYYNVLWYAMNINLAFLRLKLLSKA